jgi:hypothetical protein
MMSYGKAHNLAGFQHTFFLTSYPMPKETSKRALQVRQLLDEGCRILATQEHPSNIAKVTRELSDCSGLEVPYYTLRNRFQGRHHSRQEGQTSQQLLTPD